LENKVRELDVVYGNIGSERMYLVYVVLGVVGSCLWRDWVCVLFAVQHFVFFLQFGNNLGVLVSGRGNKHQAFEKFISKKPKYFTKTYCFLTFLMCWRKITHTRLHHDISRLMFER
jgi:hypothetical protein